NVTAGQTCAPPIDGVLDTLLGNQTRDHRTPAAWPKRRRVTVEVFGEVRDRFQLVRSQLELIHVPPLLFRERRDQVESIEMAETPELFSGQFSERVAVRVIAMVAVLNLAEDDIVAPVLVDEASDIGRIADEEGLP